MTDSLSILFPELCAQTVIERIALRVREVLGEIDPGFRAVTFHLDEGPYVGACLLHVLGYLGQAAPRGIRIAQEVFGRPRREAADHLVAAYEPARTEDEAITRLIAAWPRPAWRAAAEAAARNALLCVGRRTG